MTLTNEDLNIPLTSVVLPRPNYPYNCFTLDLSKNEEIKQKGVKQIFFYFSTLNVSSVKVILMDKSLACNREIKYNKFYFSGTNIEVNNLGKISDENQFKRSYNLKGNISAEHLL